MSAPPRCITEGGCPFADGVGIDVFHLLPNAMAAATYDNRQARRKAVRIEAWRGHYFLVRA